MGKIGTFNKRKYEKNLIIKYVWLNHMQQTHNNQLNLKKHLSLLCRSLNISLTLLPENSINPIQDGGAQRPPYQFFPCNFYKRRN